MADEPRRRRRTSGGAGGSGGGGSGGSGGGDSGRHGEAVRVRTARGRKVGSTLWLQRQLNDPYVRRAKAAGYRSRAAFKLAELDDRFALIKNGARVADLGAAPGGWTQVALERGAREVVGVDLLEMDPIAGATLLVGDFTEVETETAVRDALGGSADLVLSDMAANATGHRATDHVRIVALVDAAADFADAVLRPGGGFVAKVLQGGAEHTLLARLKADYENVRHAKPPASRAESPETYLIATGKRPKTAG